MSELFEQLRPYLDRDYALTTALAMMNWDSTTGAPKAAGEKTAKVIGILANDQFSNLTDPKMAKILQALEEEEEQEKLSFYEKAIVKKVKKDQGKQEKIPQEENKKFMELTAAAYNVWAKAKEDSDFSAFADTLEQVVDYKKSFAEYGKKEGQTLYDCLLEDFEEGFTVEILDDFFEKIQKGLEPLIAQIKEKKNFIKKDFLEEDYPVEKQKEFCRFLAEYIGFDFERGMMAESAHPFSTNFHRDDVRMTNHYDKNKMESALFSVIHEGGHSLYEQDIDEKITQTPIGTGTSMGMHESQSRFYENNIGRSLSFWKPIYPKLQETFSKQLKKVSVEEFVKAINYVKPSAIRTQADELTYPMHVLIRYEIEKELINGEAKVADLPDIWKEKYKKYLGVTPKDDGEGVLQDMHWSDGSFGYFPTYAIGSAIAAQLDHYMRSKMPIDKMLEEGNLSGIHTFLEEHIHKYGCAKNTQELLKETTGEEFNPDYYISYLTEKYSALYEL